ncbi:hypothetical protein TWF102_008766 [Orbilia oligospora]|uniref:Uncharacterized protein n=1 Tax=Orbilia oligospora TaxID=2813651 RepID=A0A7C8N1L2_ORBOL|nr:hypothetical protein TWF103_000630 [Orbilia oligospora]KAF3091479.1 hypothetical protein TWF102_008766 [Orbilia oligospora]
MLRGHMYLSCISRHSIQRKVTFGVASHHGAGTCIKGNMKNSARADEIFQLTPTASSRKRKERAEGRGRKSDAIVHVGTSSLVRTCFHRRLSKARRPMLVVACRQFVPPNLPLLIKFVLQLGSYCSLVWGILDLGRRILG